MIEKREKPIELHSDGWERFERAVTTVAKSPPQHRGKKKRKVAKRQKKRPDK